MAGIPLSQGIDYSGTMPNFQRDYYKTLAALKEAGTDANKGTMPPMLLGLCKEDGKVYLYDKINNEEDTENGFGYWREFNASGSGSGNISEVVAADLIEVLTAAEYEALDPKDPSKIYLIKEGD